MTEMNKTAHGETQQTVTRTIDASAKDVFDFLTLPANHAKFDGSGMVQSDDKTQRIQKVGDVFTMNMHAEHMGGDYQTDNHVVAYDPNKLVGWKTAPAGTEPKGWQWVYRLEDNGSGSGGCRSSGTRTCAAAARTARHCARCDRGTSGRRGPRPRSRTPRSRSAAR